MIIDNMSLDNVSNEGDFIPLLSEEEEDKLMNEDFPEVLPLLPVKNTVLFPGVVIPITASRDKAIKLLQDAQNSNKVIAVVSQIENNKNDISKDDLHKIGTIAKILRLLKMPDGSTTVILQGIRRFQWVEIIEEEPYFKALIKLLSESKPKKTKEYKALLESIKDTSLRIIDEDPLIPSEASFALKNIEGDAFLVNFVASNMNLPATDKQKLLEIFSLEKRAMETLKFLDLELQNLLIKNDIQSKVRGEMDQQQREYFLHQQIRTIQEELGGISYEKDMTEMQEKADKKKWSKEIKEYFEKELNRFKRMNSQAPDFGIQRNYLEFILELPWDEFSEDNFDLIRAEGILNKEHFGMEDIKERVLEHLAVLKIKGDMRSPIICLYGPPGIGKTSLGKSIAESLNRKYIRMSLGGLHDEAEIRGHRKTYIGALPGRILQNIKKAGTSNPVFVLDEIDKLGISAHHDPSSALLEVLDPEQNNSFYDNFLEMGYDLSKVMFVATANSLSNIQPALLDRMEIIEMTGYTVEEKIEIAKNHLLPKQLKEHGLEENGIVLNKPEIQFVIQCYTRESGVRALDKKIAKLVRYAALHIAKEETYEPKLNKAKITEILGPPRDIDMTENFKVPGVVTGLAWTSVGGDILFIETVLSKGTGKMTITGNLGNVMKESATIAMEYIKANYDKFNIDIKKLEESNVHIHIPEGATPKDGPSAGITMLTALVSSFTEKKVKQKIAMTGEITLRGKVLPVGGIKEKILAAKRAGIKEIILCAENKKDIEEIQANYLKGLKFHYVTEMSEVIDLALIK